MASAPAEKFSIAGTRPNACSAMNVTTAPAALGSMMPTTSLACVCWARARPSTDAPNSSLL